MIEMLPMSYETLRRDFDELRYGQFMPYPLLGLGSLSQFDPSRAPPGKAILHLWDYVPYKRPDGRSWDETKQHYADRMLAHLSKFVANIPDCVLKAHIDSPVDMERTTPSFRRGDLHGIATATYQSGAHRPTPDLGRIHGARSRAVLSGGTVPASRRRRVRRGARHGDDDVRDARHRFREAGTRQVKLHSTDGSELLTVNALERDGNSLLIKGKVFGTMPMNARLKPDGCARGAEAADAATRLVSADAAVPQRLSGASPRRTRRDPGPIRLRHRWRRNRRLCARRTAFGRPPYPRVPDRGRRPGAPPVHPCAGIGGRGYRASRSDLGPAQRAADLRSTTVAYRCRAAR